MSFGEIQCSMCGQLYNTGLDQEISKIKKENDKLKNLVRSAYSEGHTDGMSSFSEEEMWSNSSTRMCLKDDFEIPETNKETSKETDEEAYNLYVSINTNNDAEIFYEGKSYCLYGPDLVFSKNFPTVDAAKKHLKTIKVKNGKASEIIKKELAEFINDPEVEEYEFWGNQEIQIYITKN